MDTPFKSLMDEDTTLIPTLTPIHFALNYTSHNKKEVGVSKN